MRQKLKLYNEDRVAWPHEIFLDFLQHKSEHLDFYKMLKIFYSNYKFWAQFFCD